MNDRMPVDCLKEYRTEARGEKGYFAKRPDFFGRYKTDLQVTQGKFELHVRRAGMRTYIVAEYREADIERIFVGADLRNELGILRQTYAPRLHCPAAEHLLINALLGDDLGWLAALAQQAQHDGRSLAHGIQ